MMWPVALGAAYTQSQYNAPGAVAQARWDAQGGLERVALCDTNVRVAAPGALLAESSMSLARLQRARYANQVEPEKRGSQTSWTT